MTWFRRYLLGLKQMRWNLLWYLPLAAWLLMDEFTLNVWYVWHSLLTLRDYTTVRILALLSFSIAAYVWLFCLFWLPLLPLIGTYLIPLIFSDRDSVRGQRLSLALGIGLAATLGSFLLGGLTDQSWPFLHDAASGDVRIRTLPFVSCPGCTSIWH
jgi:hypothetical protein